ncbi:hypothetical protein BJ969_005002 [Saccharopolyspora gloriosae]|uniref:Uncharacterized protein n=1 Tax=Saccharopolyspora gloriosae TaxID=455344 RepID=A0A840NK21_9PSEU|nr:hypothetical protein [Saccharopolyspora gloriosae]MBB5071914.1 hypothetical protein [Saccharopolyspora gloriosae]
MNFVIESLRRTLLIRGIRVQVRQLGPPFAGTLYAPIPLGGGPGQFSDSALTGVDLDAPRPAVRMLKESFLSDSGDRQRAVRDGLPLRDPFPAGQLTLGPYDQQLVSVLAQARRGAYEMRLFLDVLADGERHTVEITSEYGRFFLTAPASSYESVLIESVLDDGRGTLVHTKPGVFTGDSFFTG